MKQFFGLLTIFISGTAIAQQGLQVMPYENKQLDSLQAEIQKRNELPAILAPDVNKGADTIRLAGLLAFKDLYPGVTIINKTPRGTIYNMPPDNMAVLVPDTNKVEQMPGSSRTFKPAPPSNMPNPLYPRHKPIR